MIESDLPDQPYHHETHEISPEDADALIDRVAASARAYANHVLRDLLSRFDLDTNKTGLVIRTPLIPDWPRPVSEIHGSRKLFFKADAMIYHSAPCDSATDRGLKVFTFKRGND